jgi:hypothetical protein
MPTVMLTYVLLSLGVPLLAFLICLIPGHIHEPG